MSKITPHVFVEVLPNPDNPMPNSIPELYDQLMEALKGIEGMKITADLHSRVHAITMQKMYLAERMGLIYPEHGSEDGQQINVTVNITHNGVVQFIPKNSYTVRVFDLLLKRRDWPNP